MGEYIQHVQEANGVIRDTRAIRFSRCPRNHLTDPNLTIAGSRFWSVKSNKILAMNELERWANFYLLVAASAATLIGLLFVVITLASERKLAEASKIPIYLTPTVIYFATVILLPALLTFPTQSALTANFCICLMGVVGLVYSGALFIRRGGYYDLQDRITYAALPFAAYGLVLSGGVLFLHDPQRGLTLVAVAMLLLLAVGIRNSWAICTDAASTHPDPH